MLKPIASKGRQASLLAYALFAGTCFAVLLPEVKIAWLLYANLPLLCVWPYVCRFWHAHLPQVLPQSDAGWPALLWAYAAFLGACLLVFIPGKKLWTLYASLMVPWSWRHLPELWELAKASRLYRLILLYLGYLLASMFWSPYIEAKAVLATVACAVTIAHFVLLTAGLRARQQEIFDRQLKRLCFLAAASAGVVIAVWYSQHPFPESRMEGFGYLDNPIQGAAVFGVFALVAWDRILRFAPCAERLTYGLVVLTILAYASLSWTRSVLLALAAGIAILTLPRLDRRTLWSLGMLSLAGLVLLSLTPELAVKLMRPEPYRPYIWLDAMTQALRHPWFGQGYFSDPSGVTRLADGSLYRYAHSHSLLLENFRIGGIVGLGLAIWLSVYSLYHAFRGGLTAGKLLPLALLVYGLLCITPNGWLLLPGIRVKEVWLIFWLPLGLAVSEELRQSQTPAHITKVSRSAG
ncbi:O-antigen ligase family protein [Methylothermus subterraneus]